MKKSPSAVRAAGIGAGETLRNRVAQRLADLSPAERTVAEYLRSHLNEIIFATAGEIGVATGTSDATVVRTAKTLGYSGLPELKRGVGQEVGILTRPSVRLRHRIEQSGSDTTALLDHVFSEAADRLAETRRLLDEPSFVTAVDAIAQAREVVGYGVGPCEMAVRYLALRLGRLGHKARVAAATGFGLADELLALTGDDVVVLFAPGRLLRDHEILLAHAKTVGARTILISDSLGETLAGLVHVSLMAADSPSGYTQEGFSAMLVADCLMLGVAGRDAARATAASELLNSLRGSLAPQRTRKDQRLGP